MFLILNAFCFKCIPINEWAVSDVSNSEEFLQIAANRAVLFDIKQNFTFNIKNIKYLL